MYKDSTALFFYGETSIHAGSGASKGAIDLAIQRERYTDFPNIAAQGIKGAIRDWFTHAELQAKHDVQKEMVLAAFGPEAQGGDPSEHAGAVAFTDARLLLFPVKSLKGIFAWVTCPLVLNRFNRDLGLADVENSVDPGAFESLKVGQAWGGVASNQHACVYDDHNGVFLEDERLTYVHDHEHDATSPVAKLAGWLRDHAFPGDTAPEYAFWRNRVAKNLLVVHDDDFRHFVKTATEIQARVALGKGKSSNTEQGGNLFYQENLPPDCMLYSMVLAARSTNPRMEESSTAMLSFIKKLDGRRLQVGGDETTGKGYVFAHYLPGQTQGAHVEKAMQQENVEIS